MASSTGYISVVDAQTYFDSRLNTTNWDNATSDNKSKSIAMGRNMIDDYVTFWDKINDVELAYTIDDAPGALQDSNCEQAIYLLGIDPTALPEVLTLGMSSAKGSVFNKSFVADKLCESCIAKLKTMISDDIDVIISSGASGGINQGLVQR